jgi:hypothetical protein
MMIALRLPAAPPQNKSNRKGGMHQNKNLTQIRLSGVVSTGGEKEKHTIPDEFVQITAYNRKGRCVYTDAVIACIRLIREFFILKHGKYPRRSRSGG